VPDPEFRIIRLHTRYRRDRKIAYHVRQIEALGLEVTLARIPDPDRPASTPVA
jgi:hypothetical protein